MSDEPIRSSKRVLEPSERIAEVLFGLIMVLTCTGSLSVAQANQAQFEDGSTETLSVRPDEDLSHHNVGERVVFRVTEMAAIWVDRSRSLITDD